MENSCIVLFARRMVERSSINGEIQYKYTYSAIDFYASEAETSHSAFIKSIDIQYPSPTVRSLRTSGMDKVSLTGNMEIFLKTKHTLFLYDKQYDCLIIKEIEHYV